jgi:hypothetical protein
MSSIGVISPEARWETSKYGAAIRPAVATMLADKPTPPLPLGLDPHFDDLVAHLDLGPLGRNMNAGGGHSSSLSLGRGVNLPGH